MIASRRIAPAACLLALGLALVPAGSRVAAVPVVQGTDDVPVLAAFEIQQGRRNGDPTARGAIHGVRRVAGGTVLYWSLGYPERFGDVSFGSTQRPTGLRDRWGAHSSAWATPRLVDEAARTAYSTLVVEDHGDCLCTPPRTTEDVSGRLFVLHAVYPPLPPETTRVTVTVGFNTVVPDLPVEDGPLLPAVEPAQRTLLGHGWPRIDLAAVAAAPQKELSVHPLETRLVDTANRITTVEAPSEVSLAISADVLFALDSAVLTPAAQGALAKVAGTVNERATAGAVSVVGHTDNSGTDAHNDVLSRQRADAVRAALEPLVKVPGLTYEVDGRGEREPVADNASDEGRQANRRVTVTFTPKR